MREERQAGPIVREERQAVLRGCTETVPWAEP